MVQQNLKKKHLLLLISPYISFLTTPTSPDIFSADTYNVLPASDKSKQCVVCTLLYSKDNSRFLNKLNFQYSDPKTLPQVTIRQFLATPKKCYATHENDICKNAAPFRIRLKSHAPLFSCKAI